MSSTNAELIMRRKSNLFLLLAIFMTIASVIIYTGNANEKLEWKNKNVFGFYFLHVFVVAMAVIFWVWVFHKKILVKINDEGIWTKKFKLIKWEDIEAFYTTEQQLKGFKGYNLVLLDKINNDYDVNFSFSDQSITSLREIMNYYRNRYGFRDSGHVIKE